MSDTPKLVNLDAAIRKLYQSFNPPADMSINEKVAWKEGLYFAAGEIVEGPDLSVGEVVVWLREQGAGFTAETWDIDDDSWLPVEDSGTYLVIPLDTEPPKESE